MARIFSERAQAGQSQYLAPAAWISLAWASMALACSAPNTWAPAGELTKAMSPSMGMMSSSSSAIRARVAAGSPSVPAASSQAWPAALASAQQEGAWRSWFTSWVSWSLWVWVMGILPFLWIAVSIIAQRRFGGEAYRSGK